MCFYFSIENLNHIKPTINETCKTQNFPILRSYSEVIDASERILVTGKQYSSSTNLAYHWQCEKCSLVNTTSSNECFGCNRSHKNNAEVTHLVRTTNMNIARCKNCSSRYDYATITPVEQPQSVNNTNALFIHKYQLLSYSARKCNCSKPNMISLSSISKYNCVPSTNCDGFLGSSLSSPKRHTSGFDCVRSKVSRSVSNDSMNYKSESLEARGFDTWTCSNCTLVNSGNVLVCDACETPYKPDVNKNASVLIKVDNWDDNDSSKQFSLPKPSYRRSFSDLPQCSGKSGANRRSLGDGILEAATANPEDLYAKPMKHNVLNKMCNSISSNILGSAVPNTRPGSCDDSKPLYTYIGISEPEKHAENHVYENQLIMRASQQDVKSHKLPNYDKNAQESM